MGEFFKIILYRPGAVVTGQNVPENVPEKILANLNQTQKRVLTEIFNRPSITILELANKLEITDRTIKRCIGYMKEKGILRRIGPDPHSSGTLFFTDENRKAPASDLSGTGVA